jgi:hypothetical protein
MVGFYFIILFAFTRIYILDLIILFTGSFPLLGYLIYHSIRKSIAKREYRGWSEKSHLDLAKAEKEFKGKAKNGINKKDKGDKGEGDDNKVIKILCSVSIFLFLAFSILSLYNFSNKIIMLSLLNCGWASLMFFTYYISEQFKIKEKIDKFRFIFLILIIIKICIEYLVIDWQTELIYRIIQYTIMYWGSLGLFLFIIHFWFGMDNYEKRIKYAVYLPILMGFTFMYFLSFSAYLFK